MRIKEIACRPWKSRIAAWTYLKMVGFIEKGVLIS